MGLLMLEEQDVIEKKNEKSELEAPAPNNPHNELNPIFDPPTSLPIDCFEAGERSYIKDRIWAGKRTAEIVDKKFGGYPKITNEQLSQATKQAWQEAVTVCKALTQEKKTPAEAEPESGNPEPTKNTVEKAI